MAEMLRSFLEEHQLPSFKTEIPLLVAFEKASQQGLTVRDYGDFRAKQAWKNYAAVGKEVLGK